MLQKHQQAALGDRQGQLAGPGDISEGEAEVAAFNQHAAHFLHRGRMHTCHTVLASHWHLRLLWIRRFQPEEKRLGHRDASRTCLEYHSTHLDLVTEVLFDNAARQATRIWCRHANCRSEQLKAQDLAVALEGYILNRKHGNCHSKV